MKPVKRNYKVVVIIAMVAVIMYMIVSPSLIFSANLDREYSISLDAADILAVWNAPLAQSEKVPFNPIEGSAFTLDPALPELLQELQLPNASPWLYETILKQMQDKEFVGHKPEKEGVQYFVLLNRSEKQLSIVYVNPTETELSIAATIKNGKDNVDANLSSLDFNSAHRITGTARAELELLLGDEDMYVEFVDAQGKRLFSRPPVEQDEDMQTDAGETIIQAEDEAYAAEDGLSGDGANGESAADAGAVDEGANGESVPDDGAVDDGANGESAPDTGAADEGTNGENALDEGASDDSTPVEDDATIADEESDATAVETQDAEPTDADEVLAPDTSGESVPDAGGEPVPDAGDVPIPDEIEVDVQHTEDQQGSDFAELLDAIENDESIIVNELSHTGQQPMGNSFSIPPQSVAVANIALDGDILSMLAEAADEESASAQQTDDDSVVIEAAETDEPAEAKKPALSTMQSPSLFNGIMALSGSAPASNTALVSGSKSAKIVAGEESLVEVLVQLKSAPGVSVSAMPTDVVIIVDLSDSMGTDNRWPRTVAALNSMADTLLGAANHNTRLALVGFASQSTVEFPKTTPSHFTFCNFTSNRAYFKNVYSGYSLKDFRSQQIVGGRTNIMAGLLGARETFGNFNANDGKKRVAILISDGLPDSYYRYTTKPYSETSAGKPIPGDKATEEAGNLKRMGVEIFAVGMDINMTDDLVFGNGATLMKNISSSASNYAMINSSQLTATLQSMANRFAVSTVNHTQLLLVDNMSAYVDYVPSHNNYKTTCFYRTKTSNWFPMSNAGLTVASGGSGLAWNITGSNFNSNYEYMLRYYVRVKPEYVGAAIHKNQTSGKTPQSGRDGVITNGETYVKSNVSPPTEIMVPAVYAPINEQHNTPASLTGSSSATPINVDEGRHLVQLIFSSENQIVGINGNYTITPHKNAQLTAPISEYVDFIRIQDIKFAPKGSTAWQDYTESTAQPAYDSVNNQIVWRLGNLLDETKHYRITYEVQVKEQYAGQNLHKDQTDGGAPQAGTDGIVTNGRIILQTSLGSTVIKVPAVQRTGVEVTEGSIQASKIALPSENPGEYSILLYMVNSPQNTAAGSLVTTRPHKNIILQDEMSMYVDFEKDSQAMHIWSDDGKLIDLPTTAYNMEYTENPSKLVCTFPEFEPGKEYVLTYRVKVKPEYRKAMLHKDQTKGSAPEAGTDGVVANGKTTVQSDIFAEEEILVPTVKLDAEISMEMTAIVEDRKSLPLEDFVYIITGPDGYTDELTMPADSFREDAYTLTVQPPEGGFKPGSYTITRKEGESKYTSSLLVADNSGLIAGPQDDTLTFEVQTNRPEISILATHRPAYADDAVSLTKHLANANNAERSFTIKLVPQETELRDDFTVSKEVYVEDNTGSIEDVEGLLYNTIYFVEEVDAEDYAVAVQVDGESTNSFILLPGEAKLAIEVTNTPLTRFAFTKVTAGTQTQPLAGAEFALYTCDKQHIHEAAIGEDIVNGGECWQPVGGTAMSGKDGLVELMLGDGMYVLAETKSPEGYNRPAGQWLLTVRNGNEQQVSISTMGNIEPPAFSVNDDGTYMLPNMPVFDMPHSGSYGIYPFLIAGAVLMLAAGVLVVRGRRQRV